MALPMMPAHPDLIFVRAHTLLRILRQALRDVEDSDGDRVVLGIFGIAVFGRAVTSVLQCLRAFDAPAFDGWYEPWEADMKSDDLCQFFYHLRTSTLHRIDTSVGIVLQAHGEGVPPPGTLMVYGLDLPKVHRCERILDASIPHLCRLYVAYLEEVVDSATPVIHAVNDSWLRQHWPTDAPRT